MHPSSRRASVDICTAGAFTSSPGGFGATRRKRRGRDSNPRCERTRTTVFETAPFNHSGTPPGATGPRRLATLREESPQEVGGLVRQQAARHVGPVVEARLG